MVGCRFGFVPPGTDTLMLIGRNGGIRYGTGYKNYNIEEQRLGKNPGPSAYDERDYDNYYWCMNLNDIKNGYDAGNTSSANPFYQGVFDNNRFIDTFGDERFGTIETACWDAVNKKLYVVQKGAYINYGTHSIVSVYQYT